jgi:hypothetical protein
MGREKSDDRVVPEGRRKAVQIGTRRGGKAVTASESAGTRELCFETADSPQGDDGGADPDLSVSAKTALPKSEHTTRAPCHQASEALAGLAQQDSCGWKHRCRTTGIEFPETSASRRAVCEIHKYGSVGAGAAQAVPATRPLDSALAASLRELRSG